MKSRRTIDDINFILKNGEKALSQGQTLESFLKEHRVTPSSWYVWRKRYGSKKKAPLKRHPNLITMTLPAESDRLVIVIGRSTDVTAALQAMQSLRQ